MRVEDQETKKSRGIVFGKPYHPFFSSSKLNIDIGLVDFQFLGFLYSCRIFFLGHLYGLFLNVVDFLNGLFIHGC